MCRRFRRYQKGEGLVEPPESPSWRARRRESRATRPAWEGGLRYGCGCEPLACASALLAGARGARGMRPTFIQHYRRTKVLASPAKICARGGAAWLIAPAVSRRVVGPVPLDDFDAVLVGVADKEAVGARDGRGFLDG